MINSILSSLHHYYVVFLQSPALNSVNDIIKCFDGNKHFEIVELPESNQKKFVHLQIELGRAYGSDSHLLSNKGRREGNQQYYWYDFYIGQVDINDDLYYFICYPYSKLGKVVDEYFSAVKIKKKVLKPDVKLVLAYMKDRGTLGLTTIEQEILNIDITKYSAEVKEEANANRINIIGNNPLNSRVFEVLSQDLQITIEPLSLKLKCSVISTGSVELAFDKLGNFRFWMKKEGQAAAMSILPITLSFFEEIKSLKTSSYINSYTLLEDEQ